MRKTYVTVTTLSLAVFTLILMECNTHEKARKEPDKEGKQDAWTSGINSNAKEMLDKGRQVFRFETFGDEVFWTDKLQLHKALVSEEHGGIGKGLTPKDALAAGLKVDLILLPEFLKQKIKEGKFLDDPLVTVELLRLNAVVGVIAKFDGKKIKSVGITCASCHSTVDSESGIGNRLDGWPNRDLNVGAIVSMAPDLSAYTQMLNVDLATVKKVLASWGPGKFDAELNLDGKAFRPDGKSAATLIPEAYGHAGHNLHTWTGGWGNVTYWNASVANLEMSGQGNFYDRRLMNAEQFPVSAKMGIGDKRSNPDMVTEKLAALQFYQLAIPAPKAPKGSYNEEAAKRGETVFNGKAKCATCHVPPLFAEPGWNTHKPDEICIDDFQSNRSPDKTYVTQGLKGLWSHSKGGFYHDGRFATLMDVVNHYNTCKSLTLSEPEKNDLVEYLKSL
jgi:mono/diheme cytochrome c family protein